MAAVVKMFKCLLYWRVEKWIVQYVIFYLDSCQLNIDYQQSGDILINHMVVAAKNYHLENLLFPRNVQDKFDQLLADITMQKTCLFTIFLYFGY
jgi:hypothetical protein